jgi:hypothetical protein
MYRVCMYVWIYVNIFLGQPHGQASWPSFYQDTRRCGFIHTTILRVIHAAQTFCSDRSISVKEPRGSMIRLLTYWRKGNLRRVKVVVGILMRLGCRASGLRGPRTEILNASSVGGRSYMGFFHSSLDVTVLYFSYRLVDTGAETGILKNPSLVEPLAGCCSDICPPAQRGCLISSPATSVRALSWLFPPDNVSHRLRLCETSLAPTVDHRITHVCSPDSRLKPGFLNDKREKEETDRQGPGGNGLGVIPRAGLAMKMAKGERARP